MTPPRVWNRLAWRLTAMIAGATVMTALLLTVVSFALASYYLLRSDRLSDALAAEARRVANELDPTLAQTPGAQDEVAKTLAAALISSARSPPLGLAIRLNGPLSGSISVFDRAGSQAHVFSFEGEVVRPAPPLVATGAEASLIDQVLAGASARSTRRDDGGIVVVAPLPSTGALLVRLDPPRGLAAILVSAAGILAVFGGLIALVSGLSALIVGAFASRALMRRLGMLSDAVDAWGRGELQVVAQGKGNDELSRLSVQLNLMAAALRAHVEERHQLATVMERQRLARDLHDTVKQHLFATAMQLGAAKAHLPQAPARASGCVDQAASLVQRTQVDLAGTLQLLLSGAPEAPWAEEVRAELAEWSEREGISVDAEIESLPLTLRRRHDLNCILTEALSNVTRHSGARRVRVIVRRVDPQAAELVVEDDGQGLGAQRQTGMGLRSMRERAEALEGGAFALSKSDLGGVRVAVAFRPQTASS